MSVSESVSRGDRRGALQEMAAVLAGALESAGDPRELEGLSRELRLVLKELEGLPEGEVLSLNDALSRRRSQKAANR